MRSHIPTASVILSYYNEANVIPELLKRLRAVFDGLLDQKLVSSYELVFVNDNSTDNSEQMLRDELENGDVVLVNMSRNFGVAECLLAGMENSTGDVVIYLDADLQDPPEVIPDMVRAWHADPEVEVVYTTRTKRDGEHPLKMLLTKFGYRFIRGISDIKLPVDSGDFKLISRKVVNHLLSMREDRPFVRGMVSWIGYKQSQVFYNRDARFDGRENTKFPIMSKRVWYSWLDRALISYSDEPLKLTLIAGILLSICSLLYIGVVIFQKMIGYYTPGWPALMCAILFIGGMQLMMLGFTGLYVGAIFRQTRGRPQYIVKEVLRKSDVKKRR